eukprot:TRINITY_DN8990_c0_g2_i1.p1 TRINITY_DN8990_c0_g2~~TRINITY_DN8990_c0_g2_i1.p1  ORF type:complete len:229 (-),score=52.72 TRINITY_DN8990_c0_g2_i1:98-784(-)
MRDLRVSALLTTRFQKIKTSIDNLSLLASQEMESCVQRKAKERSEAYRAIRENRKERSEFRKKIREVVERAKELSEDRNTSAKAVNQDFIKSKVHAEKMIIVNLIKEKVTKLMLHKYAAIERAYTNFNNKCSVVYEKLRTLMQYSVKNLRVEESIELLKKIKKLAKQLNRATNKVKSLTNKKQILEHDIEELNKEYKVLVESKKKAKDSIWPIVLLTPISIVCFDVTS